MAVTTSTDGKFTRVSSDPAGLWTCKVCLCTVMAASRAGHTTRCAAITAALKKKSGFGS